MDYAMCNMPIIFGQQDLVLRPLIDDDDDDDDDELKLTLP
jgi:hypothetical protein